MIASSASTAGQIGSHDVQIRGTALASLADWMRTHHETTGYRRLLDAVSPQAREALEQALASTWHPASLIDEIWQAEARVIYDGDLAAFHEAVRRQGAHVAEENLRSVFKVFLILASTPAKLFRHLERIWGNYFDDVEVTLDDAKLDEGHGICKVRGLGRVRHVAAAAEGWLRVGFEKVGAEEVTVSERSLAAGKDGAVELVFDIRWRP